MSLVGTTVGHIRVLGELGRGGMGEVYAGLDERLQRRVALKAIRSEYRLDPAARARFLREARMLSQLEHPHICRIYDYIEGEAADFLVLELVEGQTLSGDVLRTISQASRLAIAGQVADVLATAHERGIVHRDLKPGNLMLTGPASVKVLDFGIARALPAVSRSGTAPGAGMAPFPTLAPLLDGDRETATPVSASDGADPLVTEHGTITGSAAYMSPEQARGEPLTTASDMYTFGLVLQELFTGHRPHPPNLPAAELVARARRAESLPADGIDSDLRALIDRLKQPGPASRPTAVEAAARLAWIRDKPKRRLRRLAVAALVALLSLGALKYTMDLRAAHLEAERRRGQAEDLIGFMLGDLRQKLTPVGRLEILDEVGAKALAYFDSLPYEAQSDDELMRRARALSQIGEVRLAKGDASGAIQALDESLALSLRGVERQPTRTDWLSTLGTTHFWIGYAHWNRDETDAALARFAEYRRIAARMLELEPHREDWTLELAQAESNIGSVHHAQGRFTDAAQHFARAVALKRGLTAADPGNPRWQQELASSLSWLGEATYRAGRPREALDHYRATADILARLSVDQPENTQIRFLEAISRNKLGLVHHHLGFAEQALAENLRYRDLVQSLVAHDPINVEWRRELGTAHVSVANSLLALERHAEALAQSARARELLSTLVAGDAGNADWRRQLATAERSDAAAALALRRYPAALAALRRGRAALEPLKSGTADRTAARHRADSYLLEADLLDATGRRGQADDARVRALAAIEPAAAHTTRADLLWTHAQALVSLDRRADARPILAQLAAQEFHPIELTRFCRQHRCEGEKP